MRAPGNVPGRTVTSDGAPVVLAVCTVLVGLSAGFFHAYDSSVTRGLSTVDDATYVQAMNAVNLAVRDALFGIVFFGGLIAVMAALLVTATRGRSRRTTLVAIAAGLYLATVAITASTNVPLNEALATGVAAHADPAELRAVYEQEWNSANRLRTVTSAGALCALVAALALPPRAISRPRAATDTTTDRRA